MRSLVTAACVSLVFVTGACSSDDDGGGDQPPAPEPTFDTFVLQQFSETADDTEPVPINGQDFTFGENPNAFDGLFQ